MSSRLLISCLSKNPLSNRMWGYYGDSHKGLCIGFDTEQSNLSLIEKKEVQYGEKIIFPFNFSKMSLEEQDSLFSELCYRKSSEWKHEEEYRLITHMNNCIPEIREKKKQNETWYYQIIPQSCIKKIFIGSACEGNVEMDSVDVIKVLPDPYSFKLIAYSVLKNNSFMDNYIDWTLKF